MLSDGPVVYLAKRIPLKSADGAETTAGVAGVQMRLDYLQQLVVNATSSGVNTAGSEEYSCSDSENVRYTIDTMEIADISLPNKPWDFPKYFQTP